MEYVLGFVTFILAVVLVILNGRIRSLRKQVQLLEQRFDAISGILAGSGADTYVAAGRQKERAYVPVAPAAKTGPVAASGEVSAALRPEAASAPPAAARTAQVAGAATDMKPVSEPVRKKGAAPALQGLEKILVENWIGVLGALIMVAGAGFLSIYAAIRFEPVSRFMMLVAFSLVLFAISFLLQRFPLWEKLAVWLRSSAGGLFLLACLGAGHIPGLQWVETTPLAMVLLGTGLLANLLLGLYARSELFASLHCLVSLAALAIAPHQPLTAGLAVVVALFSIGLTFRSRWDYHLLLTLAAYYCFAIIWYVVVADDGITRIERIFGIGSALAVGLPAIFVHYRSAYRTTRFEPLPFMAHLLNWSGMALCLALYSSGQRWTSILIFSASAASFVLARLALRHGVRWLYITDTLLALLIAVAGAISLTNWGLAPLLALAFVFAECVIFCVVMLSQSEKGLFRGGMVFLYLAYVCAGFAGLLELGEYYFPDDFDVAKIDSAAALRVAVVYWLMCLSSAGFYALRNKQQDEKAERMVRYWFYPLLATLPLFLPLARLALPFDELVLWINTVLYGLLLLVYVRRKSRVLGIAIVVAVYLDALCSLALNFSAPVFGFSLGGWVMLFIPFVLQGLMLLFVPGKAMVGKIVPSAGLWFITGLLVLISWVLTAPVSLVVPGLLWLALSLLYYQFAVEDRLSIPDFLRWQIRGAGHLLLVMFLVRHVLTNLQLQTQWAGVPVRLLLALAGLAVCIFYAFMQQKEEPRLIRVLREISLELGLALLLLTIAVETVVRWQPLAWGLLALALLGTGHFSERLSRLRLYSMTVFWAGLMQVAVLIQADPLPAGVPVTPVRIAGLIGVGVLFLYFLLAHNLLEPALVRSGWGAALWGFLGRNIDRRRNALLIYPLTFAVAWFLYSSFSGPVLTLALVLECFVVFVASILLREKHFRYVAMAGIVFCVLRLVVHDLSRSDMLVRGLVFIGIGIVMLLMYSLYNRFRGRFE